MKFICESLCFGSDHKRFVSKVKYSQSIWRQQHRSHYSSILQSNSFWHESSQQTRINYDYFVI